MKFAVSSYSFSQLYQQGKENQLSVIKKAKKMGFDAIEFAEINPHDGSEPLEYAKKLKEECDKNLISVSNLAISADFINGCDSNTADEIERVKRQVDIASVLGAKTMRQDATWGGNGASFDKVLPKLADALRQVTEYAMEHGIKTMVENHGFFCQDSVRVEKLFNAVNHENFGLLCDIGNFMCVDEQPEKAVSLIAPYAFYVHAKDFYFKSGNEPDPGKGFFGTRGGNYLKGAIIGQGAVPVVSCMRALKRAEYDGYISVEYEGAEDCVEGISIGLENLKRYLALAGY